MFLQTLYFLIDLYFVARLGDTALAGVGAAGNVSFLVFALTQVLGAGTVALISHAVGRKDRADATLVFNQSLGLSATCAVITLALGYRLARPYMRMLGSDAAMVDGGTGIVQPTIVVQVLTVVLNAVLAPVLIAGWGTGHPLGVAGAGLASSLAVAVGVVLLGIYLHRLEKSVAFDPAAWRPRFESWGRLLRIGLPAAGRLWRRHPDHAEHFFARDGRVVCDCADRGTELWSRQVRAGSRSIQDGRLEQRHHHVDIDLAVSLAGGVARARVHDRTHRNWRA